MTKRTAKLGLGWGQSTPCSGLKQLLRLCMKRTLFSFRDVPHRPLIISSCHVRLPNFPFFSLSFYPDVNSVIVSPRLLKTTTLSWSWERERLPHDFVPLSWYHLRHYWLTTHLVLRGKTCADTEWNILTPSVYIEVVWRRIYSWQRSVVAELVFSLAGHCGVICSVNTSCATCKSVIKFCWWMWHF